MCSHLIELLNTIWLIDLKAVIPVYGTLDMPYQLVAIYKREVGILFS